ncbi:hypothetical protein K458DRAFT_451486 [Lentithecium fluviatile CBS 122367]|uniref:Uncharacterized protein n=1 Tax=Lentithecium fluviatile CBS 122367 TaxID=1168545 RepID=A0A6G1J234_9PLEO|nr:hypothetical protein K458DRAFT_451486 [Lentithecium fluviatile CBS 122367]
MADDFEHTHPVARPLLASAQRCADAAVVQPCSRWARRRAVDGGAESSKLDMLGAKKVSRGASAAIDLARSGRRIIGSGSHYPTQVELQRRHGDGCRESTVMSGEVLARRRRAEGNVTVVGSSAERRGAVAGFGRRAGSAVPITVYHDLSRCGVVLECLGSGCPSGADAGIVPASLYPDGKYQAAVQAPGQTTRRLLGAHDLRPLVPQSPSPITLLFSAPSWTPPSQLQHAPSTGSAKPAQADPRGLNHTDHSRQPNLTSLPTYAIWRASVPFPTHPGVRLYPHPGPMAPRSIALSAP